MNLKMTKIKIFLTCIGFTICTSFSLLAQTPLEDAQAYLKANYGKWKYNDYEDNLDILKQLPNFNKAIKWNPSFAEFAENINQICP